MEAAEDDLRAVQDTKVETVSSMKPSTRRYAKRRKLVYKQ